MDDDNLTSYDIFAPYYRELIHFTKHINNEISVIVQIADKYCSSKKAKILDAACGTGDALLGLYKHGYHNIEGLDASKSMILQALGILPECVFYNVSWESLKESAIVYNKYDLIFILSMSLGHASNLELENILHSFYKLLNSNGLLVVDNRSWILKNNTLIQKNRPQNIYINSYQLIVNNQRIIIDDKCTYIKNKQKIVYRIREDKNNQKVILKIPVFYEKRTTNYIINVCALVGFDKIQCKTMQNWPYEIIIASK